MVTDESSSLLVAKNHCWFLGVFSCGFEKFPTSPFRRNYQHYSTVRLPATLAAATHRLKSGKAKGTHKLESTVSVLRKRNQQTQLTRQSLLDTKPRWVWLTGDVCVVLLFGFCGNDQSSLFCARTVRTLHAQSVLRPHPNETMDQSAKKVF